MSVVPVAAPPIVEAPVAAASKEGRHFTLGSLPLHLSSGLPGQSHRMVDSIFAAVPIHPAELQ